MILYTVDRTNQLSNLNALSLSKVDPFNLPYYSIDGLLNDTELESHLLELFPDGLSRHGWTYLKTRHTHGQNPNFLHHTTYLTEMNYEYVRKAYYPDKPSRLQSIFACESLEDAKIFRNKFAAGHNRIYKIVCKKYYKVDMNLIFLGTQNIAGSFLAHQYWKGKISRNPFFEYIVELPAKISNIVLEE